MVSIRMSLHNRRTHLVQMQRLAAQLVDDDWHAGRTRRAGEMRRGLVEEELWNRQVVAGEHERHRALDNGHHLQAAVGGE